MRLLFRLTTALALVGCAPVSGPAPRLRPVSTSEHFEIAATLARLAIDDAISSFAPAHPGVAFLRIDDRDASDSLIQHLASPLATVARASRSEKVVSEAVLGYQYRDRITKERGFLVFVDVEGWSEDGKTVQATYGWDKASLATRATSVKLRMEQGKWIVTDILFELVS